MLTELPSIKVQTAGAWHLGRRPCQGQDREMPMYNQRMGTRNWYLPQLLTAELRVQATSEDSLEHSEVQSPHWSGGEWVRENSFGMSSRATDDTAPQPLSNQLIQLPDGACRLPSLSHSYLGTPSTSPTDGCCSVSQTNSYQINKTNKYFLTPSCSEPYRPCRALNVTKITLSPFLVPGLPFIILGRGGNRIKDREG